MWKLYTISILLLSGTLSTVNAGAQDIAPTGNLSRLLRQYNTAGTDTGRINALLRLSNWYLTRAGDDRNILDSATLLANQAAALSHRCSYSHGYEEAGFLLAKTAFKEKDWSGLRRLADLCHDSIRVRLALTVMNAHHVLKEVSPEDNDSAHAFSKHILLTPAPNRSPLQQRLLLLRLAIYYSSRDDSAAGTAPTLSGIDFTKDDWHRSLRRWLSFHLRADSLAAAALTGLPQPDPADSAALYTIQRAAAWATAYEAGIHWFDSELAIAEKEYLIAIDLDRKSPIVEGWPYFTIIEFYLSNGNASKALSYGLEAVSRLQYTGNPTLEFEPYWCLGQVNDELNKPVVARTYYDSVLAIFDKRNQNPDAWLFKSVTQSYLKENNPAAGLEWLRAHVVRGDMGELTYRQLVNQCFGDCYFALGQYTRAEPLYMDCYNLGSRINRYNQTLAAFVLGKLYIQTKQYDKARTYLKPLLQPADYFMVPLYVQRDVHLLLYTADSATGDYLSAMRHLRTHQALNDSLFNIARNSQIQELAFKYETERKDRELRLQQEHIRLLQNQAQLQHATLSQVRTLRNTLIWGSLMLVLLLAVLYNRYRIKQKNHRLLRSKQLALNDSNRELQRLNSHQQKLLAEREWLINEVHHRVKTNLQIVTSLLNMQVGYLNDEFTLHAFGEIGSRIRTLSLIHQRLYREEGNLTMINMRDYIYELAAYLLDASDRPEITINQRIDPIELNITQCVPVGLILNEAITNALRFAFPAGAHPPDPFAAGRSGAPDTAGVIDITMHQSADGRITLIIADNGIGLPPDFDPQRDSAMGLQLIKTLGEQLDGEAIIESRRPATGRPTTDGRGLRITIVFQRQESDLPAL
ncbi:MAG TPA: sensor histidine kinase [Puia sp.]|uniref:sensor histidine kinase n=1 Tax=Puia sp. TaxID=2045100 RepID=UPI002CABC6F9|nr:sensor histidine kinase [Puia sp.]HVU95261.1 sensor histidine kinase [Puia sp.]